MATYSNQRRESGPPSRSGPSGQSEQRRQRRRPFRGRRRKRCAFCADKTLGIDYKTANQLQGFLTDRGKIMPRRASGLCAKHQRQLALAIKRARHLALLPFTA